MRRQTRTISKNLILLINLSDISHLFSDVQVASQIECACRLLPASRSKKNLLRQVKLPDGSSKKPWIDMTSCGRILCPFVATCFGTSRRSKIEKIALPSQLTQLDPVTRHVRTHFFIFKYSLIRPTSAFKKTHNRRTLGLLLNRLKLALFLEGKKK